MGSNLDFKSIVDGQLPDGSGGGAGKLPGNFPLSRQPSIYSLTFDEFQNSMGGLGKDFGSMNMDEFLKNIWTAEETQAMASAFGEAGLPGGNLQRQGSLTLPRTLSQKTVDEVWRDLFKDNNNGAKDGSSIGVTNLPQRQQTLGEITLEEFLVRAGVVREDDQVAGRPNDNGFGVEFSHSNGNTGLALGFSQPNRTSGAVANRTLENNNLLQNQSPNLAINTNGIRSSLQQPHQSPQPQTQQQFFPKQAQPTAAYVPPVHLANTVQLASPGVRGGAVGIADPVVSSVAGGGMGMVGLGAGAVPIASVSPANQLSTDGLSRSNGDTSSLSPVPYAYTRGRSRSGAVEKVVERRQRRMIKNRESAARSRARKQAYTMELEAEVAKLKEENQKLQEKQAEILKMQKNQFLEMINQQSIPKKRCLRRTQTGPW